MSDEPSKFFFCLQADLLRRRIFVDAGAGLQASSFSLVVYHVAAFRASPLAIIKGSLRASPRHSQIGACRGAGTFVLGTPVLHPPGAPKMAAPNFLFSFYTIL
jgi:hypothetical protein